MKRLILLIIRLYQKTLSFDHGPLKYFFPDGYCRFYPSCSEYGYLCIKDHGFFKGIFLMFWRIFRCNPSSEGGVDEPPLKKIQTKEI